MKKMLVVVAVIAALSIALVLTGCGGAGSGSGKARTPQAQECFGTMGILQTQMLLFHADMGTYPPIADIVAKTGSQCSEGGKYSFDTTTGVISCSVHGVYEP